ncbi:hypothetical protein Tco_0366848 [Tanacetum coccineum]
MLVLPADPCLWSEVISRWESITINRLNNQTWSGNKAKLAFVENLLGESEKLMRQQWRTVFPEAYYALEAIADEPQNITSQVRQLILLEDPYRGSTDEQDRAYRDLDRITCEETKNLWKGILQKIAEVNKETLQDQLSIKNWTLMTIRILFQQTLMIAVFIAYQKEKMFEFKIKKPEESSSNWKPWHKDWDAITSNQSEDDAINDDGKYHYNRKGFLEDDESSDDSILILDYEACVNESDFAGKRLQHRHLNLHLKVFPQFTSPFSLPERLKAYNTECWTGLHEMAMTAFESQYIDRDTYSAFAEDIEVHSYFFDDQLTNLSPPRNCMPPNVPKDRLNRRYMSAPTILRYFIWSTGVPLKSASRSQDGKDDKDNDKGSKSRSQSMKEQDYNEDKDQEHSSLNDKSNLTDLMKECHQ